VNATQVRGGQLGGFPGSGKWSGEHLSAQVAYPAAQTTGATDRQRRVFEFEKMGRTDHACRRMPHPIGLVARSIGGAWRLGGRGVALLRCDLSRVAFSRAS
jgi:hypothetical protein